MIGAPRESQYSPKAVAYLLDHWRLLRPQVTDLLITLWQLSATAPAAARDQLSQGVGRRLDTMLATADAVFTLIPPSRTKVSRDVIKRATINLQAFLIHTVGVMDNMAWAYLHWHGLQSQINRNHVDLFKVRMQELLPQLLVDHLTSVEMVAWRDTYLKPYRDALAHRIPPYIPETHTQHEAGALQKIEDRKRAAMAAADWDSLIALQEEASQVHGHGYLIMISFAMGDKPIYLHPQMLADFETIIEVLRVYLKALPLPPRIRAP